MEQMKNMKDISGNLSDEVRWKNAEDMIWKIASMMDLGSSDSDE